MRVIVNEMDTGGPAFPRAPFDYIDRTSGLDWYVKEQRGMSLRDWFAGQALNGIYAAQVHGLNADHAELFSRLSFEAADAMLAERAKADGETEGE